MKDLYIIAAALGDLATFGDKFGRQTAWAARGGLLLASMPTLLPLAKVDFDNAKESLKTLTDDNKAELAKIIGDNMDLVDKDLEMVIEEGIGYLIELGGFINHSIEMFNKFKNLGKKEEIAG